MTELFIIRHGESKMNSDNLFCGWSDSRLTDKGRMQALKAKEKLKDEDIDVIISSDLKRCYETAEIINKDRHLDIIYDNNLRELNFGVWEGLRYDEIREQFPDKIRKWEIDYLNFKVPKGESLKEMYLRGNSAIEEIIQKYKNKKILIISHSGIIRSILSKQICGDINCYWKFKIFHCSINRIEYLEDNYSVVTGINQ